MRLLQLTDIHVMLDESDADTFGLIEEMIRLTKPDMIAVTGDVASTQVADDMRCFKKFCPFIEAFGIPWAFTFGNHDGEHGASKAEIEAYLSDFENCLYQKDGYFVDVPGMRLLFTDSSEAGFLSEQVDWYKDNAGQRSLAFFHVPMYEFKKAYKRKNLLYGKRGERVCCPKKPDGMFGEMQRCGTLGVFAGHDHLNDYCAVYKGVRLTYCNALDANIFKVKRRGGLLIDIRPDGTFTQQRVFKTRKSQTLIFDKIIF